MQNLATFLLILLAAGAFAQSPATPVVRTKNPILIMYLDGQRDQFNGINDLPRIFSYDFGLEKDAVPFSLVSEIDSVAITLQYSQMNRLLIIRQAKGDTVTFQFTSHKQMSTRMEKGMTTQRGFRQFDAFSQELLRLYRQRKPGQTVADLYPAILDWAASR